MGDGVVAVDAVHHAGRAGGQRLRRGALDHEFLDLASGPDRPHQWNGRPIGIGRHVLDAHRGIGVPVNSGSGRRRLSRSAHVQVDVRDALRIRLVVGVLAHRQRLHAMAHRGRMTRSACLERRAQVRLRRRDRLGIPVDQHVRELPRAGHLVLHERPPALADVAIHARDSRMRRVLPGGVLRVHRRVARLTAELRRLHRVQRPVPRDQHDDHVDRGQCGDGEQGATDSRLPEIDHGPGGRHARIATKRPAMQPDPERNEQQAEDEDGGQRHEDDEARIGIVEEAERGCHRHRDEADRAGRSDEHPGNGYGMPE